MCQKTESSRRSAGVDEVGRGPLAGPVVAAAVVFYEGYAHSEIRDSKKLSARQREQLVDTIKGASAGWAIVAVGHRRINELNIRAASRLAMSLAVRRVAADLVLVDGDMQIDTPLPQRTIVGGDNLRVEIAAASILAKVYRDQLMDVLDRRFPGYGFSGHAGYPTSGHRRALAALGPCPIHRRHFRGVREFFMVAESIAAP